MRKHTCNNNNVIMRNHTCIIPLCLARVCVHIVALSNIVIEAC
jgi:hypothetical protein